MRGENERGEGEAEATGEKSGGVCERARPGPHLRELRLLILHAVRLVDNEVAPRKLAEGALLADDHLVGGDADFELVWLQLVVNHALPLVLVAVEVQHLEARRPVLELAHPVGEGRLWREDEEGAGELLDLTQPAEQRDSLKRLAQAHLVGEDAVDAVLVQVGEPVEASHLVRPQAAVRSVDEIGLLRHADLLLQPAAAAARAAGLIHAPHHLLVLLLFRLAALFLLGAGRVIAEAKVLEEIRLAEQKVEPLLSGALLVAHDGFVLSRQIFFIGRQHLLLLRCLWLVRAASRLLLHLRSLLRALHLTLRRSGRRLSPHV